MKRRNCIHRNGMLALAAATTLALPAAGFGAVGTFANKDFQAADGDWNVATNWSHTYTVGEDTVYYVPGSTQLYYNDARIGGGRIATLSEDLSSYASQVRGVTVGQGSAGTLNITDTGILGASGNVGTNAEGVIDLYGRIDSGGFFNAGVTNVRPGGELNMASNKQFTVSGGTFNIMGGSVTDVGTNGRWWIRGGAVNHSAGVGSLTWDLEVAGSSTPAVYNLSDTGTLDVRSVYLGRVETTDGEGTLNVSGGTLNVRGGLSVLSYSSAETGAGAIEVSGGSVTVTNDTRVGNPSSLGSGTFRVIGNQGDIALDNMVNSGNRGMTDINNNAPLIVWQNGTLNFQIGADGVSTIDIVSTAPTDGRSMSFLAGTLDMDLLGGFTPADGQIFDLVTTNVTGTHGDASATNMPGLDITGLSLAPSDTANWTFGLVNDGDITTLQATYVVPEPASLGLLAVGAVALLGRRRRAC